MPDVVSLVNIWSNRSNKVILLFYSIYLLNNKIENMHQFSSILFGIQIQKNPTKVNKKLNKYNTATIEWINSNKKSDHFTRYMVHTLISGILLLPDSKSAHYISNVINPSCYFCLIFSLEISVWQQSQSHQVMSLSSCLGIWKRGISYRVGLVRLSYFEIHTVFDT